MEVDPSDEEAEEEGEAADLEKEPDEDLKSRINAFKYIGTTSRCWRPLTYVANR